MVKKYSNFIPNGFVSLLCAIDYNFTFNFKLALIQSRCIIHLP